MVVNKEIMKKIWISLTGKWRIEIAIEGQRKN